MFCLSRLDKHKTFISALITRSARKITGLYPEDKSITDETGKKKHSRVNLANGEIKLACLTRPWRCKTPN